MKLIRKLIIISYTFIIKTCFFKKLKINPIKSHFTGRVFIDGDSRVEIGNGFRSKGRLNINVRNGILSIGRGNFFNLGVSINCLDKIEIGDNCLFGENIMIYDHDHNFSEVGKLIREQGYSHDKIKIGNNVWIGSGSIILKGAIINDNSIIAAGSIVKGKVDKNSIFIQKREKTIMTI